MTRWCLNQQPGKLPKTICLTVSPISEELECREAALRDVRYIWFGALLRHMLFTWVNAHVITKAVDALTSSNYQQWCSLEGP